MDKEEKIKKEKIKKNDCVCKDLYATMHCHVIPGTGDEE